MIDEVDLSPMIIESSYTYIQVGILLYIINNVVIIFLFVHINRLHQRTTMINSFLHDNISMLESLMAINKKEAKIKKQQEKSIRTDAKKREESMVAEFKKQQEEIMAAEFKKQHEFLAIETKEKEEIKNNILSKLHSENTKRQVNTALFTEWIKKNKDIEEYDRNAIEAKNNYWKGQNSPLQERDRFLASNEYSIITDTYNKYHEKVHNTHGQIVTIKKHVMQETFQGPMATTSISYGNTKQISPVPTCSPFMKQFIEATHNLFQIQQKQINILKGIE